MKRIWNIYGEEPKYAENPEGILTEYANQVYEDTEKRFRGLVTETIKEDTGDASYALYLVAPELRDYMYRLIEVNIQNLVQPYPLELKLFAKAPINHRSFTCDSAQDFRKKLEEVIESPVTSGILMHLKTLIEIKGKMVEGEARVATLATGEKINAGFQRIEGDEVVYYTGKGLREIFRPNMTPQEKIKSEELKKLTEDELIIQQYMARKKIVDFKDIE